MTDHFDVLIVGGGHGGAQTAVALRQAGFAGTVGIVGDEAVIPYERPPLSKEYLSGEKTFERLLIRPASFWRDRQVAMLLERRVVSVDPAGRSLGTADGATFGYGKLVWSAGGSPRRLSCKGHDLDGVHSVRTIADVNRMMSELPGVSRVCVVGGGYIGLEAAAVLTRLGRKVTLLEALPRVLARVAGEPLSRFYEAEHRAHGVDVRLEVAVECVEGSGGKASGVCLASGEVVPCEMVIVGIGIVPAVLPLTEAGAAGGNGVDVDEFCRTSLAEVFAVGDCARHASRFAGGDRIRLESVQNANDQAIAAARAIVGTPRPYDAVPWFWSSQYDLKLQTVGLSIGHDSIVVRGDPAERRFSLVYLRDDRVVALDCVNATKDFVQGRKLVEEGARVSAKLLGDVGIPLKG